MIYKSSCPEVLCKKGLLKHFAKFTGKHLCQGLIFNKVAGPISSECLMIYRGAKIGWQKKWAQKNFLSEWYHFFWLNSNPYALTTFFAGLPQFLIHILFG